ncbi:MAG: alpha/beta hydrolase, partial [Pseudomonas sp.]|nr:alpha/beta hydrolase [Pseudomonas sp.]
MSLLKYLTLLALPLMLGFGHAQAQMPQMMYRQVMVDGVNIAYREIGDVNAPAVLLLHGVPSSSRMYDALMRQLGDRFHLIAPDYPGFGNSDAPSPDQFVYTFDHLATLIEHFTDTVGLKKYSLFMQDYGAPV